VGAGLWQRSTRQRGSNDFYVGSINRKYYLWNCSRQVRLFMIPLDSVGVIGNFVDDLIIEFCRYGRKRPLILSITLQAITSFISAFVPWFWVFLFFRFLLAISTGGTMVTSFVLCKLYSKQNRVFIVINIRRLLEHLREYRTVSDYLGITGCPIQ